MGPERNMWIKLRRNLRGLGHITRHEDTVGEGVPDVSFGYENVQGWLELKCLRQWPKKPKTIVKVKHFTPMQRNWIRLRGQAAGHVFLLLKVDQDWLLFDWRSADYVGKVPKNVLFDHCIQSWGWDGSQEPGKDLLQLMTKP